MEQLSSPDFGLPSSFNYTSQLDSQVSGLTDKYFNRIEEAPIQHPETFVDAIRNSKGPESRLMKFKKGTTTLGFRFQGGIILAVDSRAS
jgi:20S proteasome subunit beta 5